MQMRNVTILMTALFLVGLGGTLPAQTDQYNKFLSIADIQKVTGLKDLKQLPKSEAADGDLNFARQDGKLILSASFYDANAYASARSSKQGFKSTVAGVGEEAFVGPAGGSPLYILAFRKGNYTVVLNTEIEDSTTALPIEQIIAIAKIMATKM